MWIEPTSFLPDAGGVVGLRLRVGQDFLGDPIPRDPALIDQFISVDSNGRKPVYGHDGADPPGLRWPREPGLVIIGYQSHPKPIVLPATTFNQYLKDEGLEAIAELRSRRNQTNSEAREIFSRCAKSSVLYGTPAGRCPGRSRARLHALGASSRGRILTPARRPRSSGQLDLRGPSASRCAGGGDEPRESDGEDDGSHRCEGTRHVSAAERIWLIKAVHMIPAPAGTNADWASFWASLTFELKSSTTGVAAK